MIKLITCTSTQVTVQDVLFFTEIEIITLKDPRYFSKSI